MKKTFFLFLMSGALGIYAQDEISINVKLDSLGKKIERTLSDGDGEFLNGIYDLKEMSNRFLVINTKSKKIKKFNNSFFEGFSSNFNFGSIVSKQIDNGSSYEYLKHIKEENDYYLLFRLYGDGLNYHKHLIKQDEDVLKIIDSYIYLSGEFFSETFKKIYNNVLISEGLLSKSEKSKSVILDDLMKINKVRSFLSQGNVEEASKEYSGISDKSKEQKLFKIIGLQVASNLSEEIYNNAILDYKNAFPNDISLYLVSIDGYIIKENYNKALEAINKLDSLLEGDPFLNFMRGNIHYLMQDLDKAIECFVKVGERYPDFMDPFDSLLSIYIEKENTKEAINMLNKMVDDFALPKDILFDSLKENYPDFSEKELVVKWSK